MPLTTTLEDMADAVQRTADVVAFVDKHPLTRIYDLINQGLGALSRLCRTTNPLFQPIASTTVTADGVATIYSLPSNFRSLLSVEYTTDGRKVWLQPYAANERAALTSPEIRSSSLRAVGYALIGRNIELLPLPPSGDTALLWYATTVTQLEAPDSPVDTMERLDTYVIWWAAREIAMEREAWDRHDRLTTKMEALEGEIRILARSLDLSNPARVPDITNWGARKWGRGR